MTFAGNCWCDRCQQVVDVETEDNITFECMFCGDVLEVRPEEKITGDDLDDRK
jgi:hypothetical protein